MKLVLLAIVAASFVSVSAQIHRLEKLWETDAIVKIPETVLPYQKGKKLYVSPIDGGGWDADGKGLGSECPFDMRLRGFIRIAEYE